MSVWFVVLSAIMGVGCVDSGRSQAAHCGRICGLQSRRIFKPNLSRLERNLFHGLVQDRKIDARTLVRNPVRGRAMACIIRCLNTRSPRKTQSKVPRLRRQAGNHPDCPKPGLSPGNVQNISVHLERSPPGVNSSPHWTVVVRWSPLPVLTNRNGSVTKWTGYSVAWFMPELMASGKFIAPMCKKVPKNQTTTRITGKDGWVYPYTIQIAVTTFPVASKDINFQGYSFSGEAVNTTVATQVTSLSNYLTPGHIVAICIGLIGGGVLVASLLAYVRHKTSKRFEVTQPHSDAEVFVSYSRANYKWVNDNLLRLMDHNGISYLIDYKDFEPGLPWLETLVDCIRRSHNVLIIMSREYMSRSNCLAELQQAMYWAREGRTLIVLRINDINKEALPCPLRNRTFIDYADRIERQTWKRRLVRVLKASRSPSAEPLLASVSSHCSGNEASVETTSNEVFV